ncbi:MAG TPA: extracellular solute-binding protein, partial [Rhizobiaceae bacterium]|nr:extracellular solute-binding protein [Rhizobiaceae bacterium]
NPLAKFHDGHPVTAQDVTWTFDRLVELNPSQRFYYQHVVRAEALDEHTVRFTFDEKNNRELPQIVGQMPVLPKHWWEGVDANGKQRNIAEPTLEPPLGSGPYRIGAFNVGSTLTYERVADYWGKDVNVNIGRNNFDMISYTYFLDRSVEFEAFKADNFDYWEENEAKRWATGYDFPKIGSITREELPNAYRRSGLMVGFVPNLRREQFRDARVRKALNLAFDFESLNRTIFFGQYERINSFFYGIDLASSGLPQGKELEILETVRDKVPADVFAKPYANPVNQAQTDLRNHLREALMLLGEAGYERQGEWLVNKETGKPLRFELLLNGPIIERVALPYKEDLRKIGVDMVVRTVDASQYVNRVRSRDYDMIYSGWGQSYSPGNEQFDYWGSAAADKDASRNYAGISDPAVDELIRQVVFAKDRETLVAATKALDRVLLANQYVIPSYAARKSRIAYWSRFSHPDPLPEYSIAFPDFWWFDAAKAEKVK